MNIYLIFAIIAVLSYFVGTINFSRIIAWRSARKDITKLGSGNPGTMNMLRNLGFLPALLTFLAEVVKAGVCCLVCKIILEHTGYAEYATLAYFFAGAFIIIGNDFPVFFHFKGGKGIACMVGMFLFTPLWWVGLIIFVLLAILLAITEYAFISSFGFIVGMSIAVTVHVFTHSVPYAIGIVVIVWLLTILAIIQHRGNLARMFKGQEHKAHFKSSIKRFFKKQKGVEEIKEEHVESAPENEIIIEDDEKNGN